MRSAAICYRRHGSRIEFLLVKTKGGNRWTFPKGHVKKGERPDLAAAREAREEAGVTGRVEGGELLRYRYPSGPESKSDVEVRAFLMEVAEVAPAEEPWRKPRWFFPAAAQKKLAEGRGAHYAKEHARLLEAALAKLNAVEALEAKVLAKPRRAPVSSRGRSSTRTGSAATARGSAGSRRLPRR
jgi:8-oxo-dGTP pyrophosphatase MutT (NUDIX family)